MLLYVVEQAVCSQSEWWKEGRWISIGGGDSLRLLRQERTNRGKKEQSSERINRGKKEQTEVRNNRQR